MTSPRFHLRVFVRFRLHSAPFLVLPLTRSLHSVIKSPPVLSQTFNLQPNHHRLLIVLPDGPQTTGDSVQQCASGTTRYVRVLGHQIPKSIQPLRCVGDREPESAK
ncbi:uncharacterized protein FPRO_14463 [Fusarium proliferatum ET1]|uniref:Uncharacterized protein n=1 Tax=Fusarium proliferatum (strain ET1) TaxID=1227346 RepID=A0A1L7VWD0_FUSPR|nr:uncharacterized protein FPRO_14463 [Fusarium proliferatum ET1]CZR44710.1 uncharacterized protein FPRO_14463 [Fusarium proliferatum ET1]